MARVGEGLEVGADGFDVHPCSRHALHLGVRGAAPSRDQRLRDLVNATPRSRCTTAKSIAQATQLAYLCALALHAGPGDDTTERPSSGRAFPRQRRAARPSPEWHWSGRAVRPPTVRPSAEWHWSGRAT